ncbi:MAG: LON peptidase substrate-binding domain-containing protein [Gammaproteobacteria bacterium]|nr:LON peptidase substrate-binding domain-containing protein [Gammaproteobacteria bacterium]MDH5593727.1 LON peptidase substrate-binding domain-containing protein [Gammaproteobacteria bacterium]
MRVSELSGTTGETPETLQIPIFPLNAVLFPGGALPLRIFEPRYLDMISNCLKKGTGFGVCLISEGREVGVAAQTYEIGTLGHISYFQRLPDGLLGVTVRGDQRFRVISEEVRPDQLAIARVEMIPNDPVMPLTEDMHRFVDWLKETLEQMSDPYSRVPKHYDDAGWVSNRLSELLPIPLAQKQYLLQLDDPRQRIERLSSILDNLDLKI